MSVMALLVERCIHQVVYGRRGLVTRYEALAEVTREVVIGGLGPGPDDAADRVREAVLHVEAGKGREDGLHLIGWDPFVLESAPVETDPCRAERDVRLLVQGDGRRGIQGHRVPDQLHTAVVEAFLACECPRRVGSLDLEASRTREGVREPNVMKQRADGEDLCVVRDPLQLPEPDSEEPGSNSVVARERLRAQPG